MVVAAIIKVSRPARGGSDGGRGGSSSSQQQSRTRCSSMNSSSRSSSRWSVASHSCSRSRIVRELAGGVESGGHEGAGGARRGRKGAESVARLGLVALGRLSGCGAP